MKNHKFLIVLVLVISGLSACKRNNDTVIGEQKFVDTYDSSTQMISKNENAQVYKTDDSIFRANLESENGKTYVDDKFIPYNSLNELESFASYIVLGNVSKYKEYESFKSDERNYSRVFIAEINTTKVLKGNLKNVKTLNLLIRPTTDMEIPSLRENDTVLLFIREAQGDLSNEIQNLSNHINLTNTFIPIDIQFIYKLNISGNLFLAPDISGNDSGIDYLNDLNTKYLKELE